MNVDPEAAVTAVGVGGGDVVGAIAWAVRIEARVRAVERDVRESAAYQRIIIRGLVTMGVVSQDDVDEVVQDIADRRGDAAGN